VRYIFICCAFFISSGLYSQHILSGKVVEAGSGEPLSYANIVIKSKRSGTTTNVDGFFTLYGVPADTSIIQFSYVGYQIKEAQFNTLSGTNIKIELEPTVTSLNEIVVQAQANNYINVQEGISTVRLSTKQITTLPSIGEVDIFRSLQLLPGVSGTNENSAGLFVRGGTPDQNLVLLDGMTVYKVDHFFGFFSAFNANAIKDVQLFKGGFPAKYGGRTSSVVDLTGKTGSFDKFGGSAGVNFLSANASLEIPIAKRFSILLAGRRSYTDVIQSDLYKNITGIFIDTDQQFRNLDFNTVEPEFYFYDWNAKVSFRPSDKDMISLSTYNGRDFLDQSRKLLRVIDFGGGIEPRNASIDVAEKTNWGNKAGSLKWSRQWNSKWYSNLLVAGSEYFSNYDIRGIFQLTIPSLDSLVNEIKLKAIETNRVRDYSFKLDNDLQLSEKHKLSFGAAHTITSIDYSAIRDDTLTILESDQKSYYTSLYVADTWSPFSNLTLEAGLRASYYEMTDEFLWSPRVSISHQITSKIKLVAGYGLHYQFVNRIINETITEGSRDFWLMADGELVNVSSAEHYILGASYETNGWLFDIEGYWKELKGLTEFSLQFRSNENFDPEELFFTGNGTAQGIELLIQKKTGQYSGWLSYTLGQVVHTFDDLNEGDAFYALHDQRHEIKLVNSYDIGEWSVAANFIFGSGKPFSEPDGFYNIEQLNGDDLQFISVGKKNGSRIPAYHRLDISAHHRFPIGKAKADIGISLFNIYGNNNVWYYKFNFQQKPFTRTEVTYLGFTPNLSFNVSF
jgi:outer membrane receptor for ferrienterochelin and colicin